MKYCAETVLPFQLAHHKILFRARKLLAQTSAIFAWQILDGATVYFMASKYAKNWQLAKKKHFGP